MEFLLDHISVMNLLLKNNIKINLPILFIGVNERFLNSEEVLKIFYDYQISFLNDDELVELEINKNEREEFITILERITIEYCDIKGINFEFECENASRIWQFLFLNEIASSSKNIDDKLNEIENIWARFDYPENWQQFIYYWPNENLKIKSKEAVYNLFLEFLREAKKNFDK